MTSCCCADPSCQVYGCRQYRQTPYWQGPTYSVQPIPVLPRGCVCPPGSEATCKGIGCPRRGPASAIEARSGETADAGSTDLGELNRAYEVGFRDALAAASALVRNEPPPIVSDDLAAAILQIPFPDSGR